MSIRNGRLGKNLNKAFLRINSSIDFDRRLYREDIQGSVAYARALQKRGVLSKEELGSIVHGLESIEKEIEKGGFSFKAEDEDIHMNIERRLFELIGETAYKLHTGRSRNEQVVLDERLYLVEVMQTMDKKLDLLFEALLRKAKHYLTTIIPSYTHLRQAQAVSLAHIFLAYYHALCRDRERLKDFEKRLKVLPLGSGAVAGSSFGIDRDLLKKKLGFEDISRNSIDAVSTRDYIVEFEFICVSIFITLSRISEDIIIYSSEEFGYYELPDELSTTSSLLPQKKNPDSLELIRGKTARVVGNFLSIITLLKGLPYTYNRDLQEDKEGLFDTVLSCIASLDLMTEVVNGMIVNEDAINRVLEWSRGKLFATDIADYLVGKGISFREAHRIVGTVVRYANEKTLHLKDIPLQKYRHFCPRFDDDVYGLFDYIRSVNTHDVPGGTALKRIAEEIKRVEEELKKG